MRIDLSNRASVPSGAVAAGRVSAAPVLVFVLASALLPSGMPLGVVLQGVVLGGLSGLTAMGLVLVYRSARVINFAQAEIGGLASSLAVILVAGRGLPYLVAVPLGLVVAVGTGALIDATVVRRFFTAPRLILMVATVGLAQILGAIQVALPTIVSDLRPLTSFSTPFDITFRVDPLVFKGDHVVAMVIVPIVLVGLAWFFGRSDTGVAIRAAADSTERALLLGIPVRRLSRTTWMLAAGLSGVASILSTPILGPQLGALAGPTALLAPLAAAVLARMESLPRALFASIGISVAQQAIFWSYPRSSAVDVGLFVLVLGALIFQRGRYSRTSGNDLAGYVAVQEVRPVPAVLAELREVQVAKRLGVFVLGFAAIAVPLAASDSRLVFMAFMAIFATLGVSLVVLAGWAGQVSLGQFAFAGIGGATCGSLLVHARLDLFIALLAAAGAGALASLIVGIPALRISGPFLAVTTLAFGVPVSTYLLNAVYFPTLNPSRVARPVLFGDRVDLHEPLAFYYFCLAVLVGCYVLVRNLRESRFGRMIIGVRDNERAAAGFSIEPTVAKMSAFAVSGAIAGVAGGLNVVAVRGVPFGGFSPITSLQLFTMVVIGGLGSLPGAIIGALYVQGAQYFLSGAAQLLATGAGLLVLLMLAPGGIGHLVFGVRDRLLRELALRKGLEVPGFTVRADAAGELSSEDGAEPVTPRPLGAEDGTAEHREIAEPAAVGEHAIRMRSVDSGYGSVQVLFGVDLDVQHGEVVALLGTNGAGKSTALRVLAGLNDCWSGTEETRLEVAGTDFAGMSPEDRVRAGLVMVPGGRGVFPSLTVAENLRLASWIHREDEAFVESTTAEVLELFPRLQERLETAAGLLSGGEQQMLTIGQALLCRPKVLLIDELSLGLAPTIVADLLEVVRSINATGVTVVIVEQSVNVALELAERAVFMERGAVRFTGPTAELAARPDLLRSVFLQSTPGGAAKVLPTPTNTADAAAPPALEVQGLGRAFGGVAAVADVSFTATRHRVLGIIGSNGAGKTTMFDLCSGYLPPDAGTVLLHGRDVTSLSAAERADRGLGRTFQDARLFPTMTVAECLATAVERHVVVRDVVSCGLHLAAADESERRIHHTVEDLLEIMGLGRYRNAFVSELSTGTRRIVELAAAMAHQPSVLLLDEPAGGVAQREIEALAHTLAAVRDQTGTTMILIEHDIPFVSSFADDLVCMHLGSVIAAGAPADVLADPLVVSSYLGSNDATIKRSGVAAPA